MRSIEVSFFLFMILILPSFGANKELYSTTDQKMFNMLYGQRLEKILGRKDKEAMARELLKGADDLKGGVKYLALMTAANMVDENTPELTSKILRRLIQISPAEGLPHAEKLVILGAKACKSEMYQLKRKKTPYRKNNEFVNLAQGHLEDAKSLVTLCMSKQKYDLARKAAKDAEKIAEAIGDSQSVTYFRQSSKLSGILQTRYGRARARKSIWGLLEVGAYESAVKVSSRATELEKTCILVAAGEDVDADQVFAAAFEWDEKSQKIGKDMRQVYLMRASELYQKCIELKCSQQSVAQVRLKAISDELGEMMFALRKSDEWVDLSTFPIQNSRVGYGHLGVCTLGGEKKLEIAGIPMESGFKAHANSCIEFNLKGQYREFQFSFGLETSAGGSAKFRVVADGKEVYKGPGMWKQHAWAARKPITVKIVGVQKLELIAEHLGSGAGSHSAWGNCKLR